MKRNWLIFYTVFVVLALLPYLFVAQIVRVMSNGEAFPHGRPLNDDEAKSLANWLRTQPLEPGENAKVMLPVEYKGLAAHGILDLVFLQNGKVTYFLKTSIGYKGNYDGYIYVDSGAPLIIEHDSFGRDTLGIGGRVADPYFAISQKLSNNLYAVYSDLG